ncbi:UNVERIFIED_CONTAM: hypothetical protein Sindi_1845200 [Sesamum indicum]
MPRSSRTGKLEYDPEIEKTARKLRWESKQPPKGTSAPYEDEKDITLVFEESSSESREEIMALIPERSIKDMTSPDMNQQPLCIKYPNLVVNFELKSRLIHLHPTFHGLIGENPYKHLKEFHVRRIDSTFYLQDPLQDGMISRGSFLRNISLPQEPQRSGRRSAGFVNTRERILDHLLIQYFYEGLSSMDRKLIDAASGGALFNKTPTEARNLISIMASNTQQLGVRYDDPPKRSNEVSNLEDRLNQLTSIFEKVFADKHQQVKACGICTLTGNATDMCPTFQESTTEHVDAVGGFAGQQQRRYDPFCNTYNPRWRDHLNLSYGNQYQNFQKSQYRPPPQPNPTPNPSLEDMMKALVTIDEHSKPRISNQSTGIVC